MTLRDQLTVLVPTANRQDRLLRVLRYYAASRCPAPMRVLDSSDRPIDPGAIEPFVRQDADASVTSYAPTMLPLVKMLKGLETVRTPYVVIWADDDLLMPSAFEEGVRLLSDDPRISVVHGHSGLFRLDAGRLQWVAPYLQRAILDETASARLRNHFRRYSVTFYSIHRTEALRKNFETICRLGLDWHTWGELALGALGAIQGKVFLMDRFYMIRETHGGMGSVIARAARGSSEPGGYETFRDCLVPELIQQDQMDVASARDTIAEALQPYLAEQRERQQRHSAAGRGVAMAARLRTAATRVPGLKKVWRRAQAFLHGHDRAMTLPALLRPTSRYHRDFMPAAAALTTANGHEEAGAA